METDAEGRHGSPLIRLPSEIVQQILSHLSCPTLVSLTRTCRLLRRHAENDILWTNLIRECLPDPPPTPYPFTTFRSLYMSQYPHWFLPKHKLWFSDNPSAGKLILVKYDARRCSIEGFTLVGSKGGTTFQDWPQHSDVIIYSFNPTVALHHDRPVIRLAGRNPAERSSHREWWEEVPMEIGTDSRDRVCSTLILNPTTLDDPRDPRTGLCFPTSVSSSAHASLIPEPEHRRRWRDQPPRHTEISERTFCLRTWMQFSGARSAFGVSMGEAISTWGTLDPQLYTPTRQKPYQGIWVGDYAGHGCEFLLVMQRETIPNERYQTRKMRWSSEDSHLPESDSEMASAMAVTPQTGVGDADDETGFKGRIEAVKLTGDDNIPRGEYTWIANDIGPAGFIRVAEEEPFRGARIVTSRGHVAARGFEDDEFISTQLMFISHDRLAQFWEPLGHVSYYERVDLDALMKPSHEKISQRRATGNQS